MSRHTKSKFSQENLRFFCLVMWYLAIIALLIQT